MNQATDSALRYVIGHMSMNDILTTGRSVVRENTWKALNEIIKSYDMGLEVIDVNFQSARPPEEVKMRLMMQLKRRKMNNVLFVKRKPMRVRKNRLHVVMRNVFLKKQQLIKIVSC